MEEAIKLWKDQVPFNSAKSKYEDLQLTKYIKSVVMVRWALWVFGKKLRRDNTGHDDYIDRFVIKKGKAQETYEDVPTIKPFVVKGSKTSVVIAPGGGFCDRMDQEEGDDIARILNKYGISAFVVAYRLAPYRFPIPCLDIQRAVRWVRFYAEDYGISPDSVGAMGFSAGGYAAAGAGILLGDCPVEAEGYLPDEIDAMNGMPDYLCPIYPVVAFDVNPCMLANLKGPEFYTNEEKRKRWRKEYSLIEQVDQKPEIPQFFAYGNKDMLGGYEAYAEKLNRYPEQNQVLMLDGAGHGFAHEKKWTVWSEKCIEWIKKIV